MVYVLFVLWFFLLIKWANLLVDGSSALAKKFFLSDLIIWLTIVAFGTSAPELVVNVVSSVAWNSWLVIGNILWSNIANILLILWISAIVYPLVVTKKATFIELPFSIFAVLLLGIVLNDWYIYGSSISIVSRIDGLVLLLFFILFMRYIFYTTQKEQKSLLPLDVKSMSLSKMINYIVLWLVGLLVWGEWIVDGAVKLSEIFWMSQSVVWLTIVALWTSLPELTTSVVAVMKKKSDIAIGNVIWSNIFNILWVLWISAIISPISFNIYANRDICFAFLISVLLFLFIFFGKKFVLQRYQWRIMVLLYFIYMGIVIFSAN